MVLSHLDGEGKAHMVDVSGKEITRRTGVAGGFIYMHRDAIEAVTSGTAHKGNVFATARIAGIQAAKITGNLIPLAHPLPLDQVSVDFDIKENGILITARVVCNGRTGVEMEALTAVAVSALTIYDMCKSIDKEMMIGDIRLLEKHGGVSGHYIRGLKK
ncbi:MAG: cyclic pyranopterin monophosphate synthase MoaC [bacterium]|nr:cyclic pyranopterin monophosphate synthase MoaC [bacterium]